MEMELTLLVMAGSPIQTLADADQPGRRIVVYERSANEEMVRQKLSKATRLLVPLSDYKKAFEMIKAGEADAFADLLDQTGPTMNGHAGDAPCAGRHRPKRIWRSATAKTSRRRRPT